MESRNEIPKSSDCVFRFIPIMKKKSVVYDLLL